MSLKMVREIFEWLSMIMLLAGIITAALDTTFSGFTPIMWFLLALLFMLIVICAEVTQMRELLENKNKKID